MIFLKRIGKISNVENEEKNYKIMLLKTLLFEIIQKQKTLFLQVDFELLLMFFIFQRVDACTVLGADN